MKKGFCLLLVILLLVTSIAFGQVTFAESSSKGNTFSFTVVSYVSVEGSPMNKTLEFLQQRMAEVSNGRITVNVPVGGSMGNIVELIQLVQLGELDVAYSDDLTIDTVVGGIGWAFLPFVCKTYDDVDRLYLNGWIGDEVTKELAKKGIVRVVGMENEFRLVATKKTPIRSLNDFRGVKIRVPENAAQMRFYENCGALAVGISAMETLTALEQGTISGVDNSLINLRSLGIIESVDYVIPINYIWSPSCFIASESFWNKMNEADRNLVQSVFDEAAAFNIEYTRGQTADLLTNGSETYGYEVLVPSDEFFEDLYKAGYAVWDEFSSNYDAQIMERLNNEIRNK